MLRTLCLLILALLTSMSAFAQRLIDMRVAPISQQDLVRAIRSTPFADEPAHTLLIGRAGASHLLPTAYQEYTTLWQDHSTDARMNLYRGMAAYQYWQEAMGTKADPFGSPKAQELIQASKTCLAAAYRLTPSSPNAMMEYGFYLYREEYQQTRGMALLHQAAQMPLARPRVHRLIGELTLLSDPKTSEQELRLAAKLDPGYAMPHWYLFHLYAQQKRFHEAQKEMRLYKTMVPQALADSNAVTLYATIIDRGLKERMTR